MAIIVPDTSVLIEGLLSKAKLGKDSVIIHEAAVAELEHQANQGRETGYLGLDEIGRLQALAAKKRIALSFKGERPGEYDIKGAGKGMIDALIRDLAQAEGGTLWTADVVQARVAEAKGIPVKIHEFLDEGAMDIEGFFDETTMSVHVKENCSIKAKRGKPGAWEFAVVRKEPAQRDEVERLARQIVEAAGARRDGFVELERKGSTICQVGRYRIVITRPPMSDGYEITAVRPVKRLSMADYELSGKLQARIAEQAEGILIAGAPGHGKSTFAQALAEHYASLNKVIKTVEAPRDLILADEITQYAISHSSAEEIHDILLLSRPDYTIFDEMRNTQDFSLFADMRLSGVGMIGVIHATKTIDAIQRFLGRIELGVIPHVVDTVIFIKDGRVGHVYSITMTVKVPSGMTEADLARPIVEVHDFESNQLVFEIYTYGEQTVVIPVKGGGQKETKAQRFVAEGVERFFQELVGSARVEMAAPTKAIVKVPAGAMSELIGRGGERIKAIEHELGVSIDLQEADEWYQDARKRKKGKDRGQKAYKKGKKRR